MIHAVNSIEEILKILETNNKIIILNFHSETCGPCIMQMPILEDLSNNLDLMLITFDVKIDESDALRYFHISSTPTTHIYKDGKLEFQHSGFFSYEEWEDKVSKLL